jgi:hypothetical protein
MGVAQRSVAYDRLLACTMVLRWTAYHARDALFVVGTPANQSLLPLLPCNSASRTPARAAPMLILFSTSTLL